MLTRDFVLGFFHLVDTLVESKISEAMINCWIANVVSAYIGVGVMVFIGFR